MVDVLGIVEIVKGEAQHGVAAHRMQHVVLARYQLASSQGPDHDPWFEVEVLVESEVIGRGEGGKKADAERAAAQDALERLEAPVWESG